jgi:hypothetical protein
MPTLTELWLRQKDQFEGKRVDQVIGWAGDGKLRDETPTSRDFRDFLAHIPSSLLAKYAQDCLSDDKFTDNGCALQDIVNEIGKRIGFRTEPGRYRGKASELGHDGLWRSDEPSAIVVEVKATDAISINLDTIANYRKKLIVSGNIIEEQSSILIVVGRSNTGSLEAQVRGSRHAWDIRMISIEALVSLMEIKEELEHPDTIKKIRAVLTPKEFTKLDAIVDLVFTATKQVQSESQDEIADEKAVDEDKAHPVDFRDACANRVQAKLRIPLVKRTKAFYSSADETRGICIINSRAYHRGNVEGFWFSFHPHQQTELNEFKNAYLALGCGSDRQVLLIPWMAFQPLLKLLNKTEGAGAAARWQVKWHVRVRKQSGKYLLQTKAGNKPVDLSQYAIADSTETESH